MSSPSAKECYLLKDPSLKGQIEGYPYKIEAIQTTEDSSTDLFYIWLSEEEAKKLKTDFEAEEKANQYLRKLDKNTNYHQKKAAIQWSYVGLIMLASILLCIAESWLAIPSPLLLSGLLIYSSFAVLTLIPVLVITRECIKKIRNKKDTGLYLLTLILIWIGFLFSVAVLCSPAFFLSLGILPFFSAPLASIAVLTFINSFNARQTNQILKQWCDTANTKISELAFEKYKLVHSTQENDPRIDHSIKLEEIKEGDVIKIEPNQTIPLPGLRAVKSENSELKSGSKDDDEEVFVSEAVVTGESTPKKKRIGDTLEASSKNGGQSLYLKVAQNGKKYLEERILSFNRFDRDKTKEEKQNVDNNAAFLLIALLIIGITATTLLWLFLGPMPLLHYILLQSLCVVACFSPSAFAFAQALPLYIARGFLFKKDIAIEDNVFKKMHKVNIVVFDKTGTLTGEPTVCDHHFEDKKLTDKEILPLLAVVQAKTEKNIYAPAVCDFVKSKGIDYSGYEYTKIEAKSKRGACGQVKSPAGDTEEVLCGTHDYIRDFYPDWEPPVLKKPAPSDKTVSYVVIKGQCVGWIAFDSQVRSDAKNTIQALKQLKEANPIKVIMLTGDPQQEVALATAKEAGIIDQHSSDEEKKELVVHDNKSKEAFIRQLRKKHPDAVILMVGDGENDVKALQEADIGLAITSFVKAAVHATGNLRGKLMDIIHLIKASATIHSQIQSNIGALLIKTLISILIAGGILYPLLGILLSPAATGYAAAAIGLFSGMVVMYNWHALLSFLKNAFEPEKTTQTVQKSLWHDWENRNIFGLTLLCLVTSISVYIIIASSATPSLLSLPILATIFGYSSLGTIAGFALGTAALTLILIAMALLASALFSLIQNYRIAKGQENSLLTIPSIREPMQVASMEPTKSGYTSSVGADLSPRTALSSCTALSPRT